MAKNTQADIPFKIPDLFVKMDTPAKSESHKETEMRKIQTVRATTTPVGKVILTEDDAGTGAGESKIFIDPGAAITPRERAANPKILPQPAEEAALETIKTDIGVERENLIRGLIWAEILGKPKALRRWEEDGF